MRSPGKVGFAALALALLSAMLGLDASVAAPGDIDLSPPPVPYVIGGDSHANPGYVAVLLRSHLSDPEAANFCGGSLIRVDVVMTAAHCVDDLDPDQVEVGVGFTLLSSIGGGDRVEVSQISIHPAWDVDEHPVLTTDIALLRLADPTVGLPIVPIEQDPDEPSPPRALQIVGWGYVDYENPGRSVSLDSLQAAGSTTLTGTGTATFLANLLCLLDDPGDDFCHGTSTTGTCQGDSGGPVLAETALGSGVMEAVGIVSFGPSEQCLHPSYYDGAQRISPYLGWIDAVLDAWNEPPDVAADEAEITVDEGDLATNAGIFGDREADDVTVTASVGTIIHDSGSSGTWSWSYTTHDGPAETQTVTITASDGSTDTTTFDLTVENVAPSVTASARTVRVGASASIGATEFSDPGDGDSHTATVDWGDGSGVTPAIVVEIAGAGSVDGSHAYAETGEHTVTACVSDDDGAESCDEVSLTVIADLVCPDPVLPFGDVSASSFALADIGCIFGLGITEGTSASTFSPDGFVTREQMAAFLGRTWRALGLVCPDPVLPFGDVSASSFALADIGCIFGLGITEGTSATTFSPDGFVTREQMAAFIARLLRALELI
jgi:hypothetical protein